MAMSVVMNVRDKSEENVLESFSLSFLADAISRTPTVAMPIIEIKIK
jgi:hypothetical protein